MNDALRQESYFTAAHEAAPHPEHWHSLDADTTENEVALLVAAFVRAIQPEYVVETGTAFGWTTRLIGEALHENGHGRCVSLEIDESRCEIAREHCEDVLDVVEIRAQSSLAFQPEEAIDFAFFDSLYELRRYELMRYRAFGALLPGTIVGFHDWASGLRGHYIDVREEIEALEDAGIIKAIFVPTPRGVAFAQML